MSDQWKAGTEVYKTMETLIANNANLAPLALVDDEILIVFKEKASKNGDHVISGKTAKANALLSIVDPEQKDWKFVITLAGDEWQSMSDADREALLFHHLCACGVEENPETGNMKCFVRLPDVSFFREEVEKYGFWRTSGTTPEPDLIDELFGEKGLANQPKLPKQSKQSKQSNP
jgi:hypothetical protein